MIPGLHLYDFAAFGRYSNGRFRSNSLNMHILVTSGFRSFRIDILFSNSPYFRFFFIYLFFHFTIVNIYITDIYMAFLGVQSYSRAVLLFAIKHLHAFTCIHTFIHAVLPYIYSNIHPFVPPSSLLPHFLHSYKHPVFNWLYITFQHS